MKRVRWQDMLTMVLGLWIAASPWALGFGDDFGLITWNALAIGVGIVILAAIDLDAPAKWEEWAMVAAGGWSAVSPYALGFMDHRSGTISMVAAGLAVAGLAGWVLVAPTRADKFDEHAHGH